MFEMLDQFWTALTRLFKAAERVAVTIDNLAAVGEFRSEAFLEEQKIEQGSRLAQARAQAAKLIDAE